MLNKIFRKLLIVSATLLFGTVLYAQDGASNGYTPYSIFGVGEISKEGTAYNKSMGGVGIATRNNRFINIMNPAAVTARDTLSFMTDFGLSSTNKILYQNDLTSANNTFNMYNFVISFPVYKSSAMYAGITPYSNVNYNVSSVVTDPALIETAGSIKYSSIGSGGLYNAFVGGGVTFWDRLSLGAQLSYYLGSVEKSTTLSFANTSQRSFYSGNNHMMKAANVKLGVQYDMDLGQSSTVTVGATYKFKSKVKGETEDYSFSTISSYVDTLSYTTENFKDKKESLFLAGEIGVGVAYKYRDKLIAEIDYSRSDWSNTNMDKVKGFAVNGSNSSFTTTCAESLRGGIEYTPNRNDIRYFMKKITYRGGAYYDKEYYMLNNNPVKTVGITFGMTIPIYRLYNGLTLGVDMGQRGYSTDQMVKERFINFNVSFNLFDLWFQKIRYE